jgi:hypothetical protein
MLKQLIYKLFFSIFRIRVKTNLTGNPDKDTILLHSCFSLLSDFVEIEEGWLGLIADKAEKDKIPWYMTLERYRKKHARRLGLKYLGYKLLPNNDISPEYARSIREIIKLYEWWKDIRPNRSDPYDDLRFETFYHMKFEEMLNDEDYIELCREVDKKSSKYYQEDTKMLVRLMNIRQFLWS